MPECPVCEHVQEGGEECQVCGRRLGPRGAAGWQVEPIPGLEPTSAGAVQIGAEGLAGLEPTRLEAGGEARPEPVADWLERTGAGAVAPAALEVPPGLELHRAAPVPGDAADPLAATLCRYCREPAAPGDRFCPRCGMRLPLFDARQVAAEVLGARCPECGGEAAGPRCRRCGAHLRAGA